MGVTPPHRLVTACCLYALPVVLFTLYQLQLTGYTRFRRVETLLFVGGRSNRRSTMSALVDAPAVVPTDGTDAPVPTGTAADDEIASIMAAAKLKKSHTAADDEIASMMAAAKLKSPTKSVPPADPPAASRASATAAPPVVDASSAAATARPQSALPQPTIDPLANLGPDSLWFWGDKRGTPNRDRHGPMTRVELLWRRRNGELDADHLVWSPALNGWHTFRDAFPDENIGPPALPDDGEDKLPPTSTIDGALIDEEAEVEEEPSRPWTPADTWPTEPVLTRVHIPMPRGRKASKVHRPTVDVAYGNGPLGLLLGENDKRLGGVLVASVDADSQGEVCGIPPYSVVARLNGIDVSTLSRNALVLRLAQMRRPLMLTFLLPPPVGEGRTQPSTPRALNAFDRTSATLSGSMRSMRSPFSPRK